MINDFILFTLHITTLNIMYVFYHNFMILEWHTSIGRDARSKRFLDPTSIEKLRVFSLGDYHHNVVRMHTFPLCCIAVSILVFCCKEDSNNFFL